MLAKLLAVTVGSELGVVTPTAEALNRSRVCLSQSERARYAVALLHKSFDKDASS